jgi:hypothetical protein
MGSGAARDHQVVLLVVHAARHHADEAKRPDL